MLLFRDIKQNYPIYILDRQKLTVTQGSVKEASFLRMETNQKTGRTEMVIDVTVTADGSTATYTIPENLSVTYANNIVLATEQQSLLGEIEAMVTQAEQTLKAAPMAQEVIDKAAELRAQLSPGYREKQETEKRFTRIEDSVGRMEEMMKKFIEKFES